MHIFYSSLLKTFKKATVLFFTSTCIFLLSACSDEQWNQLIGLVDDKNKSSIPDKIEFTKPALYPEGVSYDAAGKRFLVSSVRFGTVGQVNYEGTYTPFVED